MKKKALLAAVAVMSVFPFASCADGRAEEIAYVPPEVEQIGRASCRERV